MNGKKVGKNQTEIERLLRHIAAESAETLAPTETERQTGVNRLLCCAIPPRTTGSGWAFVREQIGFVNKSVLLWYGVWAVVFWLCLCGVATDRAGMALVSMLPPLLLLATTHELAKVYCRGMMELEYTTKYSLFHVVLVRLFWMGVTTAVLLVAACFPVKALLNLRYATALVYVVTPFLLMSAALLCLMERLKGESLMYAAVSLYGAIALFLSVGSKSRLNLFAPSVFAWWCVICAAGLLANAGMLRRVARRLYNNAILYGGNTWN